MSGPRSKEVMLEGRAIADSIGFKLCDCCSKSNEDSLKALTFNTSLTDLKVKELIEISM